MTATYRCEMEWLQKSIAVVLQFCAMYAFESNFLDVEAPDIGRIRPKIGRLNHGRSCLPAIAHAMP